MTRRRHRRHTGDDLLAGLIGTNALEHVRRHHAACILEGGVDARRGGAAHLVVIHPEAMFIKRCRNFRIREGKRAIGLDEAIDVIAVVVGDDHHVDVFWINACSRERQHQAAVDAVGRGETRLARARIDQRQLAARVDEDRVIGARIDIGRHEQRLQRLVHLRLRDVAHEVVRDRHGADAVIHRSDLDLAHAVAIIARRRLVGERHLGLSGHRGCDPGHQSPQHRLASRQFHDDPS